MKTSDRRTALLEAEAKGMAMFDAIERAGLVAHGRSERAVDADIYALADEWEADIGRTYALGSDAEKKRLVADLPRIFERVQAHYHATSDITGDALYAAACRAAEAARWLFGGVIAGHIVGEFPHAQRVPGDRDQHRIKTGNHKRMRDPDANGNERHWILEIHLVDKARTFGGFYERLL